LESGPMSRNSL